MKNMEREIKQMLDREIRAWNEKDVETLLDLFHPDMVWPWPPTPYAHDPAEWIITQGKYD